MDSCRCLNVAHCTNESKFVKFVEKQIFDKRMTLKFIIMLVLMVKKIILNDNIKLIIFFYFFILGTFQKYTYCNEIAIIYVS